MGSVDERVERYTEALGCGSDPILGCGTHRDRNGFAQWGERGCPVAEAVMALADDEQAELKAEVERLRGRLDISERSVAEARGDNPSGFWSQREWEDWSNELAMILPEDAECWPGVNPEGAQESIIEAALRYLVAAEAKVEALADDLDREQAESIMHAHRDHRGTHATIGHPIAKRLRAALADEPAEATR